MDFDIYTIVSILITSILTFGIGIIIGYINVKNRIVKNKFLWNLLSAPYIGIMYNTDSDTISILPLEHVGEGLFYSKDVFMNPAIIGKNATVKSYRLAGSDKTAIVGFLKGIYGYAVNMEDLLTIGIADLSMGKSSPLSKEISSAKDLADRILELISEKEEKYIGTVSISPDIKFGIAISIPKLVKSTVNLLSSVSITTLELLKDNLLHRKKFLEYSKLEYMKEAAKTSRLWILLLGLLMILALYLVLR